MKILIVLFSSKREFDIGLTPVNAQNNSQILTISTEFLNLQRVKSEVLVAQFKFFVRGNEDYFLQS